MATTAADWSDPARYAYASLLALSLNERHSHESCDPEFRQQSLRRLLEHVKLMRCEPMMQLLMESESGHTRDPYVQMLLEEPEFHGDGTRVVYDALQWALMLGNYDARIRVILHEWATQLFGLSVEHFEMLEDAIVHRVERGLRTKTLQEEEREKKEMKMKKAKKFAWIGAASVGGGVLVGLTGGLVAPLVAGSLAALLGVGGGAAAAGSVAGAAVIGSLFGAAGAGVSGYKMNKRVGDVEEFFFVRLSPGEGSRLHVTICCPGWLPPPDQNQLAEEFEDENSDDDDDEIEESIERRLMQSFDGLIHSREQYGLQYETKYLAEMGRAIDAVCRLAISMAATEVLKMTIFHGLVTAVALPRTILSLTSVIDNPWNVCCNRSAQVGQMLAETLMDGTFGRRPVTLLGFSLGARVVYFCLKELHRRGGRGIVQDAVLIGTPVTGNPSEWRPLLDVVAGQLVNAFSRNDWVLKIVCRTASAAYDVAGLEGVDIQHDQLVNVDLSHLISGHGDYRTKADQCLKAIALLRVIPITTTTTSQQQQQQSQSQQDDRPIPDGGEKEEVGGCRDANST
ncbi:transmembrane and coiled-coil domain-containing protein 4-like [Daphnia pulex]|uniref:transmembrane and coiled-coil domain-containing protein 4-like n=1 Tax=Daphnia pulex TaxID=6669 RepID=UPI001EDF7B70|nr:transmembrane and coiled-coil domain-containing protein 4-like [Daphnia pulex]